MSSTLIAGAGTLLKNDPQKFMHTVDDVQRTMQCCGFAGNYTEWLRNRTIHYYDPVRNDCKKQVKETILNLYDLFILYL